MDWSKVLSPEWLDMRGRLHMAFTAGIVATLLAPPAGAQTGNLDAGKSPAQIFGDTCAACHRNARELKRTSAAFLRSHYTTGPQEATAMAQYLAGVGSGTGSDPRGAAGKRKEEPAKQTQAPAENGKQNPRQQQQAAEQSKGQPKGGRPGATAQGRPAGEDKQSESAAPGAPALEPFEE